MGDPCVQAMLNLCLAVLDENQSNNNYNKVNQHQ